MPRCADVLVCRNTPHDVPNVVSVAPDGVRLFRRLDQLPKGVLEHAVWRTVSGCPVREIVFDGRTYYVTSANPLIERLDPVARGPVDQH